MRDGMAGERSRGLVREAGFPRWLRLLAVIAAVVLGHSIVRLLTGSGR